MKFTKETFNRMLRTFIQTALSYIAIHIVAVDFSESKALLRAALTGIAVSAVAAGLSAVMNLEKKKTEESGEQ